MNVYRVTFCAACPVNGRNVEYRLTIETARVLPVEKIIAACSGLGSGFHEELADRLFATFGGRQRMTGHHHGVDIETLRGLSQ